MVKWSHCLSACVWQGKHLVGQGTEGSYPPHSNQSAETQRKAPRELSPPVRLLLLIANIDGLAVDKVSTVKTHYSTVTCVLL